MEMRFYMDFSSLLSCGEKFIFIFYLKCFSKMDAVLLAYFAVFSKPPGRKVILIEVFIC